MSLLDLLSDQLGDQEVAAISRQIGTDRAATSKAIAGALPMLVGALSKNTQNGAGAESLLGALQRDHDGSALDNLTELIGSQGGAAGAGILKHVLGGRQGAAESGLSQIAGIDPASAANLLKILAPIVMGSLGKMQRQSGTSATDLSKMLQGESSRAAGSPVGDLLTSLLDSDGDGSVLDDLGGLASRFLKGR